MDMRLSVDIFYSFAGHFAANDYCRRSGIHDYLERRSECDYI